ncbi:MAG: plasma-membrane proton-efflux P-type ATPase [Thermoproteota archaeon]
MCALGVGKTQEIRGLSSEEAKELLKKYGPNAMTIKQHSRTKVLLSKFWGLVPWMLESAILIDLVLGRWIEAIVILGWLVFSAFLGFYQEDRAQRALTLLRQRLVINARVKRDNEWKVIPASEIVPGDVCYLRAGDIVPADILIFDGQIQVDQSQLTGESLPVELGPKSTAYAGSLVTRGEATGKVLATGTRTHFGKTIELVGLAKAPARLEILITNIAKYLTLFDVALAVAVFITTIFQGLSFVGVLPFIFLLLVASVPVAAPVMFTMSASLGSQMLTKNGVLVTRLSAIEDISTMDVLCLDKTGTLTENRLAVEKVVAFAPATEDEVLSLAAQASNEATQNPIDIAIINAARKKNSVYSRLSRLKYFPFDPNKKYSECFVNHDGLEKRIILGEPFTIMKMAKYPPNIADEIERLASEGNRVLALASSENKDKSDLQIIGLIALSDPIRPDSRMLISKLQQNGVRVLIFTGDHEATARSVATKLGLAGKIAPREMLRNKTDAKEIEKYEVFAEVFPEDKFFLVKELQRNGHVVGVTGDGINDAPALKQADVGIAVANATDVAKSAASIVLTEPGFRGVVMAIDISRRIYQRMQNWTLAMITRKLSIPLFLSVGVLFFKTFVISPLLMVLFMFTGDVATFALSTDKVVPSSKPNRWNVQSLVKTGLVFASLLFLFSIGVFWSAENIFHLNELETQTLVFAWLVFSAGQAALYTTRSRKFFWEKPYPSKWLVLASIADVSLTIILATQGWLMTKISFSMILLALLLSFVYLVVSDLIKVHLFTT